LLSPRAARTAGTIITRLQPALAAPSADSPAAAAAAAETPALSSPRGAGHSPRHGHSRGARQPSHARPPAGLGALELVVGWAELEQLLLEQLPAGTVEWGSRVTRLQEDAQHVRLTVGRSGDSGSSDSNGGGEGSSEAGVIIIDAEVVVAADGALSAVRQACVGGAEKAEFQVSLGLGKGAGARLIGGGGAAARIY
jgi:2-polyprenyl-6-methoxyphenol hydroxylase-like FAD-dependent oxidoreductase